MVTLPPWPVFEVDELAAVDAVLRSGKVNYWTGTACRDFEAAWSAAHLRTGGANGDGGAPLHSICMANGSLTMDAALRVLGIGPGDDVLVSPRSYVASAMCVALAGARPIFADVCPNSGCVTAETLEAARTPRTKATIPVHIGGWPCDMPAIMAWAASHNITVIEDCAQSHGASIAGRPVGTLGDFASWSFCQDKIMTTGGEGGMLCTSNAALFKKCWAYAQHGKDFDRALAPSNNGNGSNEFRWLVNHEGTNLRMTEMQAAIGLCQLRKLPGWLASRARNAAILFETLSEIDELHIPRPPVGHANYRFVAFVKGPLATASTRRAELLRALHSRSIPAMVGSCGEIYREQYFVERGFTPATPLPNAHRLGETSLTFLVHHTIDEATMRNYASAIRACIAEAIVRQPLPTP